MPLQIMTPLMTGIVARSRAWLSQRRESVVAKKTIGSREEDEEEEEEKWTEEEQCTGIFIALFALSNIIP